MIIIADSLGELIHKFRNTPNPITGRKPLFKDLTDDIIWTSAFYAGQRAAQSKDTPIHKVEDGICPTCLGSGDIAPSNEDGLTLGASCLACGGSGK